MVIGIVAYLVLSVMMFVIIAIVFANNPNAMRVDVVMLLSAVALVCSAVLTLAAWWLTTPEPGAIDQRPVNARTIGRWCMLAQLISGPLSMAGESINPAGIPTTPLEIMLTVIGGVMTIVAIVGYVALVLYLGKLAARLPARSLAQQHKIVGWGVGISQGLGAVAALIALLAMGATFAAGAVGFGMIGFAVTMCAAGLGSVVFGVWAFVLLIIMGFRLSDAARQARTAWGDDQEAPAAIT